MGNQSRSDYAEIEIDDEDVYVSRKFSGCDIRSIRAQDNGAYSDPDGNEHDDNNEGCKGPREARKFGDPPELEMPGVDQ